MRSFLGVGIVLLAGLATGADDSDKKPDTPKAQFDALKKEYGKVRQTFFAVIQKAEDPESRQKLMTQEAPKLDKVLVKFVELADKNPKDPVALDALVEVVQDNFASRGGSARKKAIELIQRDHLTSDKLGPLCQRLAQGFDAANDKLLRSILEKNSSKGVQAEACLALMQSLGQQAEIVKRMKEDAVLVKRVEQFLGKDASDELKKLDPAKLEEETGKLTKTFSDKYVSEMKTERLVSLCQRLSFSPSKSNEALLRKIAESDKDEIKGVAIISLAQMLKESANEKADKDAKTSEAQFAESEKLFEQAAAKFGKMKLEDEGTIGEKAKSELYELKNLRVGKPAPEVDGEDQDGKKFKLSDYKGKVVLLDFWNQF